MKMKWLALVTAAALGLTHVRQRHADRQGRGPHRDARRQAQVIAEAPGVGQGYRPESLRVRPLPVISGCLALQAPGRVQFRVGEEAPKLPGDAPDAQEVAPVRGDGDVQDGVREPVERTGLRPEIGRAHV